MIFESKLGSVERPTTDVFNYLFSKRRVYSADRVLYKTDRENDTLTSEELERKSRQFAWTLVTRFGIKTMDVVAILAKDSVSRVSLQSYDFVLRKGVDSLSDNLLSHSRCWRDR